MDFYVPGLSSITFATLQEAQDFAKGFAVPRVVVRVRQRSDEGPARFVYRVCSPATAKRSGARYIWEAEELAQEEWLTRARSCRVYAP